MQTASAETVKIRVMFKRTSAFILLLVGLNCQAWAENVRETPVVKVVKKAAPCVVNIGTEQPITLQQHPFWRNYGSHFRQPQDNFFNMYGRGSVGTVKSQSLGSGILVSPDGLIATNAHVVGMASKIFVTIPGGQEVEAKLIGTDNANDIALIKVETQKPLAYLKFANDVLIGETVVSIGNPFGLENSVSAGIVSGTGRTFYTKPQVEAFQELVQTDASINQGSSGGALVNLEGNVVGMNLAMLNEAQAVSFAIPGKKIVRMLGEYEKVKKGLAKKMPGTS
jgi:serine protease Do